MGASLRLLRLLVCMADCAKLFSSQRAITIARSVVCQASSKHDAKPVSMLPSSYPALPRYLKRRTSWRKLRVQASLAVLSRVGFRLRVFAHVFGAALSSLLPLPPRVQSAQGLLQLIGLVVRNESSTMELIGQKPSVTEAAVRTFYTAFTSTISRCHTGRFVKFLLL